MLALQPPQISPPTRATLLRGVLAFRWVVSTWLAVVLFGRSGTEVGTIDFGDPTPYGSAQTLALYSRRGFTKLVFLGPRQRDQLVVDTPTLNHGKSLKHAIAKGSRYLFASSEG